MARRRRGGGSMRGRSSRAFWMGLGLLATAGCGSGGKGEVAPLAPAPKPVAAVAPPPPKVVEPPKPPEPPAPPKPTLAISPAEATLLPGDNGVQLSAAIDGATGTRRDRTAAVRWEAEPSGIVEVGDDGYLR